MIYLVISLTDKAKWRRIALETMFILNSQSCGPNDESSERSLMVHVLYKTAVLNLFIRMPGGRHFLLPFWVAANQYWIFCNYFTSLNVIRKGWWDSKNFCRVLHINHFHESSFFTIKRIVSKCISFKLCRMKSTLKTEGWWEKFILFLFAGQRVCSLGHLHCEIASASLWAAY